MAEKKNQNNTRKPIKFNIGISWIYVLLLFGIGWMFFNQGGALSWVFTVSGLFLMLDGAVGLVGAFSDKK